MNENDAGLLRNTPKARPGQMAPLDETAAAVLTILVKDLADVGNHRKLNHAPGVFMAVSVEHIGTHARGDLFSVAHYYEQNGDLMRDPEMVFLRSRDGQFIATYFRQDGGFPIEQESVSLAEDTWRPTLQYEHAAFANAWLRNIARQQGLTEITVEEEGQ